MLHSYASTDLSDENAAINLVCGSHLLEDVTQRVQKNSLKLRNTGEVAKSKSRAKVSVFLQ